MPTTTPSRRAKVSGALKRLGQAEQIKLLSMLLKAHPELEDEAEALAVKMITAVDPETVAAEVVSAFYGFDQKEIWDRSGKDRFGSNTGPTKAAGEICGERFEPLMEPLERLISMGQMEAALFQVKGLLNGLYRLEALVPQEAEDFPLKVGVLRVLQAWAKKAPEDLDPSLAEWFSNESPVDWASHLETLWRGLRVRSRKPR
jgi:hypothetical protein